MWHSFSSLNTLTSCEAKYVYRYQLGLRAEGTESGPGMAGSWMHAVLAADAIQRGLLAKSILVVPGKLRISDLAPTLLIGVDDHGPWFTAAGPWGSEQRHLSALGIVQLAADWWPVFVEQLPKQAEALEGALGAPLPVALRRLWERYSRRWEGYLNAELPLLVEASWHRTVPGTSITLNGRVDEVYRDARGLVVVRDHKFSAGWHDQQDHLVDLIGAQLHMGAWGLAPLLADAGCGRPQAVEYNRGLYSSPSWPKLTGGTKNKPGSESYWKTPPRLSASVTKFDLVTYLEFCESESAQVISEEGELLFQYEPDAKLVEALEAAERGDEWFKRSFRPVSTYAVQRHVRAAAAKGERAEALTPETAWPSPGDACRYCDFKDLCRAETYGGWPEPFHPADYHLVQIAPRRGEIREDRQADSATS